MKKPAQNWYSNKPNSGQALLIVLLGMAVVLTLVLSIVSRSVTDVSITTKDEESLRAFSAAEAGVEQLLIGGSGSGEFPNSSYTAQVYDIGNSEYYFFPNQLKSGDVVTLWFVEHDDQGNLTGYIAARELPGPQTLEDIKKAYRQYRTEETAS